MGGFWGDFLMLNFLNFGNIAVGFGSHVNKWKGQ